MIHSGDLFDVLPTLPERSVHCVVTSPPYWGLRDYGNPPRTFADGWTGCLGLEPTPELFVEHMVQAFAEVHRVLRDDGTLWLNMGDCYATGAGAVGECRGGGAQGAKWRGDVNRIRDEKRGYRGERLANGRGEQPGVLRQKTVGMGPRGGHEGKHGYADGAPGIGPMTQPNRLRLPGYKPKDLVGVPWMLAFALRAAGWYLRAEIVWAKGVSFCDAYAGSVMPESVQDRPTRSHEQVFLLTKSPRYFYDGEAVREQGVYPAGTMAAKGSGEREGNRRGEEYAVYDGTRNLRTVWTISPKPFTEAHFATFPPDLVVPCVKAGTSERGVCAECGAPWRRIVEKEPIPEDVKADFEAARQRSADDHGRGDGFTTRRPNFQRGRGATTWDRTCEHVEADVVPAVVMDCFSGAGTVGAVCAELNRRYVGVEINPEYIQIAERRIAAVAPLFSEEASA